MNIALENWLQALGIISTGGWVVYGIVWFFSRPSILPSHNRRSPIVSRCEEKHDEYGRLIFQKIGDWKKWMYYDEWGNITHEYSNDAQVVVNRYDHRGRFVYGCCKEGTVIKKEKWFLYHANGKETSDKGYGRYDVFHDEDEYKAALARNVKREVGEISS